jgi:hypothetical protein
VGHLWRDTLAWRAAAVFITFHCVCFGLLIFSGRIGAAPLSHHVSNIEQAYCYEIYGWVYDKHRPDASLNIELWDGNQYLKTFHANEFRQDLADAGYGRGKHGFHILTPLQLKDGRSHLVRLRIAGTKQELTGSPRVIRCP